MQRNYLQIPLQNAPGQTSGLNESISLLSTVFLLFSRSMMSQRPSVSFLSVLRQTAKSANQMRNDVGQWKGKRTIRGSTTTGEEGKKGSYIVLVVACTSKI